MCVREWILPILLKFFGFINLRGIKSTGRDRSVLGDAVK